MTEEEWSQELQILASQSLTQKLRDQVEALKATRQQLSITIEKIKSSQYLEDSK